MKKRNENMYNLYEQYQKSRKLAIRGRNKRQKINKYIRETYEEPFQRRDYNDNKNDIAHWNDMIRNLEDDMKDIEMYLDFNDRHYLHKEYNNTKSMILNKNSYEGEIPLDDLYSESIPGIEDIVCNAELQREITELLDVALTERQRQVVHLYFWQEKTQEEIGGELGIAQKNVSVNLQNALEILRNCIKHDEYIEILTQ